MARINNSRRSKIGFFSKSKKGISPLIATVLLIAFAVALGAVVMNWGRTYVEDTAANAEKSSQIKIDCSLGVKINVHDIGGDPQICYDEDEEEFVVYLNNKGSKGLEGIKTTIIGAENVVNYDQNVSLGVSNVKKFTFSYDTSDNGDIMQVVFTPKINVAGSRVPELCPDAELEAENIQNC
ncbi:MAG: archaellin/type IV pilin N-terminal domain-containing protein [Candidatus Woesearchaeota archaeon]